MKQYPLNKVDYYGTFSEMLEGIEKHGEKPAIAWYDLKNTEYEVDYRRLCLEANALKRALIARGLAGKHVAIVGENCYHWIITFLAVTSAGGVAVCVDTEQPDEVIRRLISQADAEVIFTTPTFYPICAPLAAQSSISLLATMNNESDFSAPLRIDNLIEEGEQISDICCPTIDKDDTAAIIFTSGTTSNSKPVMLTHFNLLRNASDSISVVEHYYNVFSSLPFYHSYGLTCAVINGLIKGVRLTINGEMRTMVRDMMQAKPESIIAVPLIVEAIHKVLWAAIEKSGNAERVRSGLKKHFALKKIGLNIGHDKLVGIKEKIFGRLKIVVCGGAYLDPEIGRTLDAFGIRVLQGYGITECSPLISVNRNNRCIFQSVGHVLHGCEVKIVDGEIWFKGPNVMKGYYKDPEATAEAIEDGWFKTGDLGSIDKNGFLYITGRIKNLIVLKNGKKISPEKIEEMIRKIPLVKDVMVYGATSGSSADDVKPAASIYPDPELATGLSSYEILDQLQNEINRINASLPPYQQVQMVSIREKEFAKTASKKIKRYAV